MDMVKCPNCGTMNESSNQLCQSCGRTLANAVPFQSENTVMANRTKVVSEPPPPPIVSIQAPPPTPYVAAQVPPPPPVFPAAAQPPTYTPPAQFGGTSIDKLGIRSDGWSDVVEESAGLESEVKEAFLDELKSVNLENVKTAESFLSNGKEVRKYQIIYNGNGTTVAVRIAPFGRDLVVSWDLYTRRTINWLTIGILGGIIFLFALLNGFTFEIFSGGFFRGLFNLLRYCIDLLFVPTLVVMLLGKLIKDEWLGFFLNDLDAFAADDAVALSTVVDNMLSRAVEKVRTNSQKTKK